MEFMAMEKGRVKRKTEQMDTFHLETKMEGVKGLGWQVRL